MNATIERVKEKATGKTAKAQVHCPICTHSVPADVATIGKRVSVVPGQKCPRCASSLNVAVVLYELKAA